MFDANVSDVLSKEGIELPSRSLKPNSQGFYRWGKNQRYWLKILGEVLIFGDHSEGVEFSCSANGKNLNKEQKEHIKERVKEAEKTREEEQQKVAISVQKKWNELLEHGLNIYLQKKQVNAFGLRFDASGTLYIPLRDTKDVLWSLQTIMPDGSKRFEKSGRTKGLFHIVGTIEGAKKAYLVEGYATGASVHMATFCPAIVAFNAGNLEPVLSDIKTNYPNLEIVIAGDNDQWKDKNIGKLKAASAAKKYGIASSIPKFADLEKAKEIGATDFNDLHQLQGLEEVRKQLEAEKESSNKKEKRTLKLPEAELWPDPVDGNALLYELVEEIERYLALPDGSVEAIALWSIFTHALDAFHYSPRLFFSSPEKQCGKSTALKILQKLCWKPVLAASISPAAIYRTVEQYKPTLLLDEADTYIKQNEDIRNVLNSGHDRETAITIRCEGDAHDSRLFSTWAAYAIAGIDRIPDTLEDRSIIVHMRRRRSDEVVSKLRPHKAVKLKELSQKIRRWVSDNMDILTDVEPNMPHDLRDRACDNWMPLFIIADAIGEEWPERVRVSAVKLQNHELSSDTSIGSQLLTDAQDMFEEKQLDRISSHDFCAWLIEQEDRPWAEWRAGKPITPTQLAGRLKKYNIKPGSIRLNNGTTPKGYYRKDFEEAFARYLDGIP